MPHHRPAPPSAHATRAPHGLGVRRVRPPHGPRSRAHTLRGMLALLATAVLVAGCGLRLETEPPPPLIPDAAEEARQRTVTDAVELADTARLAARALGDAEGGTTEPPADGASTDVVVTVLEQVAQAADAHVEALGGVYDPGTEPPADEEEGAPGAEATEAPPVTAGPDDVVGLLRAAAVTARADALTVQDGTLARLLGSVAIHRHVLAERLGGPAPADEPAGTEGTAGTAGTEDGGPVDRWATTAASVDRATLVHLVRAEDATGQAWEVVAARSADEDRAEAAARAADHRDAAERWAEAGGLHGPDDPRVAEYALPVERADDGTEVLLAPSALAELERDLAARYLALLAGEDDSNRAHLLDAATTAVGAAYAVDAILAALPGMPEQEP